MEHADIYIKTPVVSPIDIRTLVTIHRMQYNSAEITRDGEQHPFYELVCVESGEFHVNVDGCSLTVLPGEMILYAPNSYHAKSPLPTNALIYIISFETAERIEADIFNKPIGLDSKQYALLSELFTDALQIQRVRAHHGEHRGMALFNSENRMALQKIKNRLELLLISLCEVKEREATAITPSNTSNASALELARITEFLRVSLSENLTLEQIAAGCFMSVSKLKKLFGGHRPGGVIGYFNTLKIQEAKYLIRNTDMKLCAVSEALGFAYPHYFSKVFKAKTGMTPTEYARQIDKR